METDSMVSRQKIKSAELVSGTIKTLLWMLLLCLVASIVLVNYITGEDVLSSIVTAFLYYPLITVLPIFCYIKLKPIEKPKIFLRLDKRIERKIAVFVILLGIFMATMILSVILFVIQIFDLAFYDSSNYFSSILPLAATSSDDFFNLIIQFILIYILSAGIYEEVFFRGFLLNGLRPLGDKKAIVLSAASFGLYHLHPIRGIITFFISIVWGRIAYMTGNTKYAILLHITYNSIITILLMYIIFGHIGEYVLSVDADLLMGLEIASAIVSTLFAIELYKKIKKIVPELENKKEDKDASIQQKEKAKNMDVQIDENKTIIWGETKKEVMLPDSGILVKDYLEPAVIPMNIGIKISYAFYVLITLSLTVLVLLAS